MRPNLTAVLITHLHSDHITDLNDVITTRWVMTFEPRRRSRSSGRSAPSRSSTTSLASLEPDIGYRIAHHEDLDHRPPVTVIEVTEGPIELPDGQGGAVTITCGQTDHKPVEPSVGFRFDHDGRRRSSPPATPCRATGSTRCVPGADALVHTVIRKDIIANIPMQRMQDTLDYHSSPEEAAQTAASAGVDTLILTHYVPPMPDRRRPSDDWRALAAEHFGGTIELGDDLHTVAIDRLTESRHRS